MGQWKGMIKRTLIDIVETIVGDNDVSHRAEEFEGYALIEGNLN